MTYKTLMLQIYKPSRHKRDLMDAALLRYSQALQFLLDRYEKEIGILCETEAPVPQHRILKMIDKETSESLNQFGVQPFKDSLKLDFAATAATYLAQKQKNSRTGYPLAFLDAPRYSLAMEECIGLFDTGDIGTQGLEHRCSKLVGKAGKPRSVYFGRYARERDYCLLYDEFKDRFYAKLYLLNRKDSISGEYGNSGLSLKYVCEGSYYMNNLPGQRRYIVVPLAFGKKQLADLKQALQQPRLLHSARLVKKGNKYYLMIYMECGSGIVDETVTTMGVARNARGGLSYTVCGEGGAVLENNSISASVNQNTVFYLSNRIAEIAVKNGSQVILEANGGANDRIPVSAEDAQHCFSVRDYASLVKTLKYKLPEKGLPPPIEVSANSLFLTCPRCGTRTRRNRVTDELFVCIHCGCATEFEWVGSENLAKKLDRYRKDKVPITIIKKEDGFLCRSQLLGFQYRLPPGAADDTSLFDELSRFLEGLRGTYIYDPKKYAVWKKLSQAANLRESVHLILK
ncbi:zinc ribbon domain-containing protein [Caproiciproducens faecalis]|uniref:Transposase n=1 Tax=Caproiciproducens faecalis TaxID=2820301 RepID=A0ABS7DLW1_9FIRM|nr:zinc ribbon domain-containing protein [Caproiciproducens faecalis]MBW7572076.1 transposase [Caproiciproducens faecalis]